MKKVNLFLIFFLIFDYFAHSQDIDSLIIEFDNSDNDIEILLQILEYYENISPEKTIEYSDILLKLSTEKSDIENIAKANSKIGKANFYLGNLHEAHNYWIISLENYIKIDEKSGEAEVLNYIGSYYYKIDEYDLALENYVNSLKIREEIEDSVGIAYCLNNIGNVYYSQKIRNKAIEYYEKALIIAEKTSDNKIISILLNNLGSEYANLDSTDKALDYHFRSLKIKEKMNNQIGVGITLGSIGSIYKFENQNDSAIIYYKKALELFEESSNKYYISLMLNYIAGVYKNLKKYQLSTEYLEKSLEIAKETDALKIMQDNYKELSSIYQIRKNYEKALEFTNLYIQIHDSIFNSESDERIKEMQIKYETEKKEKENEILLQKQKIIEFEIQKKNNFIYSLLGLTFLVVVLIFVVLNRNRIKQKLNNLLKDKNKELEITNQKLQISEKSLKELVETKDKFFSIIAHDLRSPLSSLSLVSEMLDDNLEILSPEKLAHYIGSISQATSSLLNLVENLLNWARTQTGQIAFNPEEINIYEVVKQNITLLRINSDKKNIRIEIEIEEDLTAFADINLVTAIIRNLVANAIKFTKENGKIIVKAASNDDFVEISIIDNGIGINKEDLNKLFKIEYDTRQIGFSSEKGTGLGLILCKEFVEKNGGKIRVESVIDKGSSFVFSLKKA